MTQQIKRLSNGLFVSTCLLVSSTSTADDCERIANLAYDLQWDRQHGIKQNFEAETLLEEALINQVFHQPQFHLEENKRDAAQRFSEDWEKACEENYY